MVSDGFRKVPQPRGVIGAGGGQGVAVRTKRHRGDAVVVAGEGSQLIGTVGVANIPQPRGVIKAAGGQGAPVRTERYRPNGVGVAGEGAQCGGVVGVTYFRHRAV